MQLLRSLAAASAHFAWVLSFLASLSLNPAPAVASGSLCNIELGGATGGSQPAPALVDPLALEARKLKAVDDFKWLTDLVPKNVSAEKRKAILSQGRSWTRTRGRKTAVRLMLGQLYDSNSELLPVQDPLLKPKVTISASSTHRATFDYIEATWQRLTRKTPAATDSTLVPLPHPILIPGSRFQEAYYWDSYFAMSALLQTGRSSFVRGQIENFLYLIRYYGLVPNGNRDYYLTRSQPPFLTRMVKLYLTKGPSTAADWEWLKSTALPLMEKDYSEFWMNSSTRYDSTTGLNHHNSPNVRRDEGHASDDEERLGKTYSDVAAEAESGKDFTAAFEGEASKFAGVLLNSVLYGVERDLAWFHAKLGDQAGERRFLNAASKRKAAMQTYLVDPETGLYFDYHLRDHRRSKILTADTFLPLELGLVDETKAHDFAVQALQRLERKGGVMSSEVNSSKQWDAPYGWAPHIYFAVNALKNREPELARRIAQNWVATVDRVFAQKKTILEKYDMVRADAPIETGDKYSTQEGFLWTNGVYFELLTQVLGEKTIPL